MNPLYMLGKLAPRGYCARVLWVPLICAVWITGASAQEIEDRMGAALSAFAGQPIGIESVRPSPAPGIVEVQVINGPVLYATEDGAFFFSERRSASGQRGRRRQPDGKTTLTSA